jgi:hypothetical protein
VVENWVRGRVRATRVEASAANSSSMSSEMLQKLGLILGGVLGIQSFFSYFRIRLFSIIHR